MSASEEMEIVLQVGTVLRITNKGEVILSNPELELAREEPAADAVILYRFNPTTRGRYIGGTTRQGPAGLGRAIPPLPRPEFSQNDLAATSPRATCFSSAA